MEILVFKTSVHSQRQVKQIRHLLSNIQAISHWNFDLKDCDKILRIAASELNAQYVESLLEKEGFRCTELK